MYRSVHVFSLASLLSRSWHQFQMEFCHHRLATFSWIHLHVGATFHLLRWTGMSFLLEALTHCTQQTKTCRTVRSMHVMHLFKNSSIFNWSFPHAAISPSFDEAESHIERNLSGFREAIQNKVCFLFLGFRTNTSSLVSRVFPIMFSRTQVSQLQMSQKQFLLMREFPRLGFGTQILSLVSHKCNNAWIQHQHPCSR